MNNGDLKAVVTALAEGLEISSSARGICPFCNGGSTNETSFRVTKITPTAIRYGCFRAKCGEWGYIGGVPEGEVKKAKDTVRTYDNETIELPYSVWKYGTISKTGKTLEDYLTFEECYEQRFIYGPEDARVLMPLYNFCGAHVGYTARAVGGERRVRNITYCHNDSPTLHFPVQAFTLAQSARLVLCEDLLSAVVVSRVSAACSTQGTGLTGQAILDLKQIQANLVAEVMFDGDEGGYEGAQKVRNKLIEVGIEAGIIPCPIGKDPKDLPQNELRMLLYG